MRVKLTVSVELADYAREQKWPGLAAYVLNRANRLLARQPVAQNPQEPAKGAAEIAVETAERALVVKIGPEVRLIDELSRVNPAVQALTVPPNGVAALAFTIPKPAWLCWIKVPYLVTGTVEKQEPDHRSPVCWGEVDIYDVDIGFCFPRLPDSVIERLRDGLLDLILDPPPVKLTEIPWWPRWEPDPPGNPDPVPGDIDIAKKLDQLPTEWAFARRRPAALATARNRVGRLMEKLPVPERQSWLNREAVKGVRIAEILQTNTVQFRDLLATRFSAFRFWLCWYPWIYWLWWPWCWYSLEKLGTAKLQPGGHFSLTVLLSACRNDVPDLWFVVRQKISGVERAVYARHPVPCHTFWDHPNGKPVYLLVTDPLALACEEQPPTDQDPAHYWIVPLAIGNYSLKRIYGTGAGNDPAKTGLYKSLPASLGGALDPFQDGPFGGLLGLRFLFSYALLDAGVKYYRVKSRVNGAGGWTPLARSVVRHYSRYDPATGTLDFPAYPLGPHTVGTANALFEIPPRDPPPAPTEAWYTIDATVDLINAYFDSTDVAPGYVEFKLELFNNAGVRVNPPAAGGGIAIKLPDTENVWGTVTTKDAAVVNPALIVADPEAPAFQTFLFRLVIDNRAPTAVIDEPVLPSGATVGPCGIIRYKPTDGSVTMPYQARHPAKFAMYQFTLVRPGGSAAVVQQGRAGGMGASGNFSATAAIPALTALTLPDGTVIACPMVAYSENLYIWNMAFNGWSRVGPDASAVRPYALAPETP